MITTRATHSDDDEDFVAGGSARTGSPTSYEILHQNTSSGMTTIFELDGEEQLCDVEFHPQVRRTNASAVSTSAAISAINANGHPNIYELFHTGTPSGKTEIKLILGPDNYSSLSAPGSRRTGCTPTTTSASSPPAPYALTAPAAWGAPGLRVRGAFKMANPKSAA